MKAKIVKINPLFDMHLEYSEKSTANEKEYRDLESRFHFHFGFLPIKIEDNAFQLLSAKQQDASRAFWENKHVINTRKAMLSSRTLAEAYFNAFADTGKGKDA